MVPCSSSQKTNHTERWGWTNGKPHLQHSLSKPNSLITKQNKKDSEEPISWATWVPNFFLEFWKLSPKFWKHENQKEDWVGEEDEKEKPGAMLVSTLQPIHYRNLNSLFLPSTPHSHSAAPTHIIRYIPGWVLPAQSKANHAEPYNLWHQTKITPPT